MRLWSGKGWWRSYVLSNVSVCVWDVWRHDESFRGSESTLLGLLGVVQLSHFKLDKWTVTSLYSSVCVFSPMCLLWLVHVHLFDIPAFFCNSMHHHLIWILSCEGNGSVFCNSVSEHLAVATFIQEMKWNIQCPILSCCVCCLFW